MALQSHKACIARGHGVFATGMTLSEAFTAASMAEHSSKVRYLVKAYPGNASFGTTEGKDESRIINNE
jgi:L-fuculose-phosphate aldolase